METWWWRSWWLDCVCGIDFVYFSPSQNQSLYWECTFIYYCKSWNETIGCLIDGYMWPCVTNYLYVVYRIILRLYMYVCIILMRIVTTTRLDFREMKIGSSKQFSSIHSHTKFQLQLEFIYPLTHLALRETVYPNIDFFHLVDCFFSIILWYFIVSE